MPVKPLTLTQLRRTCTLKNFNFTTTASLKESSGIVGQPRGVRALEFGIDITSRGYNIFVLGQKGTGRTTAIDRFLRSKTRMQPVPDDWVYVHNFALSHQPRAIEFPAGQGSQFKKQMEEFIALVRDDIPKAFSTPEYEDEVDDLDRRVELKHSILLRDIERKAEKNGFAIVRTAAGLTATPVINDEVMTAEQFALLTVPEQNKIDKVQQELEISLEDLATKMRQIRRKARKDLKALDRRLAEQSISVGVESLHSLYSDHEEVLLYLSEVYDDLLDNLDQFRPNLKKSAAALIDLHRYDVNLFIDNGRTEGEPVIIEQNPTYSNLIGRIEYEMQDGAMSTHFNNIRSGSLHRANGGYLVMDADDLLLEPYAWEALKRCIKSDEIVLQPYNTLDGNHLLAKSIDPESIPLDVKILLLGSPSLYYYLYENEDDFNELFKVKADFGSEMARTPEAKMAYAYFVASRCHDEKLAHFDRSAVARVVEYGSELCEHQDKLSTRFGEITDLIREASYWAKAVDNTVVTRADVQRALDERFYRSNKVENMFDDDLEDGTVLISLSGWAVGQINALSVIDMGDYAFGKPGRITVSTYAGGGGVHHIDREVNLTGPSHDKGVLTLTGYLGSLYAQEQPLSFSSSITFEQSYGYTDGDSASSAELYALLSSISGLPLKQSIAVTGSVNQKGEIQVIGGVNEKIEGVFRICQKIGLTGDQGVMIPEANMKDLMLADDVIEAVRAKQFKIWAVKSVDEGIELLFGEKAGERDAEGKYPEKSVHGAVQAAMVRLAKKDRDADLEDEDEEDGDEGEDNVENVSAESPPPVNGQQP